MGLFKRISDIISANLNELADQYEDPEKMLKQAIREMEVSIEKSTQEAAKTIASEKRLAKELVHNQTEIQKWKQRAEQAVESNDDALARKALSRKKEHEQLVDALSQQMDAISESSSTLRKQLNGMKAKLSEAKRNLATLSARNRAADIKKKSLKSINNNSDHHLNDKAFQKFDRMKEKVKQAEAEAEALAELRSTDASEGFDDLKSDRIENDIEDELAELKRKSQSK